MGKKNSEAAVHHSSIELLQERFRQLERVKELREEREQIKALTDAGRRSPSTCYEQPPSATSKWFIHPDSLCSSLLVTAKGMLILLFTYRCTYLKVSLFILPNFFLGFSLIFFGLVCHLLLFWAADEGK